MVRIRRIYEEAQPADGVRLLVDRLWPRGLSKGKAHLDGWLKELAPSDELRRWFAHDLAKWEEFGRRYRKELEAQRPQIDELRALAAKKTVTLLYAAHDEEHNNAVVLRELIANRI